MNVSDHDFYEMLFILFIVAPGLILMRLFIVSSVGWFGYAMFYPFWLTRKLWFLIGYILANVWVLSAKIFGLSVPIIGICYYFGYQQPLNWMIMVLLYIFFFWPMWVWEHVAMPFIPK